MAKARKLQRKAHVRKLASGKTIYIKQSNVLKTWYSGAKKRKKK